MSRRAMPALLLASALTACNGPIPPRPASPPVPVPAPAPPPPPAKPVAVAVVVDQFAAWVAHDRLPLLPDGGLSRLVREGVWVTDLTYVHAATETAPGHAALFTGRPPRENGIVDNTVWRADLGTDASQIDDTSTTLIGPEGSTGARGVSLAELRVPTLADALLERDPNAVVIAMSLKDRGAIFAGGHKPMAALWYDASSDLLETSSAFASALPAWTAPFAHPAARTLHATGAPPVWDLLDRAFVAAHATTPDDQAGESLTLGTTTFPHALPPPPAESDAFRGTPMADAFLVDLALAAVDATRRPDHPMLLAISLSSNDVIGHAFGPDSWEAWDELLRLNATLGRLFTGLDARLGPSGYSVVLTGDHGVAPLPQLAERTDLPWCAPGAPNPYEKPCQSGAGVPSDGIQRAIADAASRVLPRGKTWVHALGNLLWLTDDARALPAHDKQRLDAAIRASVAKVPGVAQVFAMTDLRGPCAPPSDESLTTLVCRSVISGIGDYYVVLERGRLFGSSPTGTGHGSPYRYDRTVPLLVRYGAAARPPGAGTRIDHALFGSFYASLWKALTGETASGLYGEPI